MRKKNLIIISMLMIVAVMSIGYAYFATTLNITTTGNISSAWNVKFTNMSAGDANGTKATSLSSSYTDTTATMSVDLKEPGDEMTYELTLTNLGDITAVIEDINAEATGAAAIVFSIDGIKEKDTLAKNEYKTIKVKIEFDKNTTSFPSETTKTLTLSIRAVQLVDQDTSNPVVPDINQPLLLSSQILKNNTPQSDTNIDFSQISSDTNGKGLYYTNINTENNQTTYYFRGNVENNYVKFGTYNTDVYYGYNSYNEGPKAYNSLSTCETDDEFNSNCTKAISAGEPILWRIVRINEDGSIRIVTQDVVGTSAFNPNYNDNAYVGYMYGTTGATGDNAYNLTHANDNPSTMKTYLDEWYTSHLSNYSSYLIDAGFCNDRSKAPSAGLWHAGSDSPDSALGYGTNTTYYGAYNRLYNEKQPEFACPNASNDLFTTSTSNKGNKALTNPIGLLTADEVAYAGGATGGGNSNMYLANGGSYVTMSPSAYYATQVAVGFSGSNYSIRAAFIPPFIGYGVRPVINLRSDIGVILEGTGTPGSATNPYVVKTN